MGDFVPEDMITVEVEPGIDHSFIEVAPEVGTHMRGAFFTTNAPGT